MTSGLGARRVMTIAAAKHHTVAATEGGEVFTWGSNRGKLIHGCRDLGALTCFNSKYSCFSLEERLD